MTEASITIEDLGENLKVAHISGQLDESNVDEKIQEIYKVIEQFPQGLNLIFDLENLEYMNSKSIGYITDLYGKITESGGQVAIASAKPNIVDILQVVGLTQLISTYESIQVAQQNIKGNATTPPQAQTPAPAEAPTSVETPQTSTPTTTPEQVEQTSAPSPETPANDIAVTTPAPQESAQTTETMVQAPMEEAQNTAPTPTPIPTPTPQEPMETPQTITPPATPAAPEQTSPNSEQAPTEGSNEDGTYKFG